MGNCCGNHVKKRRKQDQAVEFYQKRTFAIRGEKREGPRFRGSQVRSRIELNLGVQESRQECEPSSGSFFTP